MNSIRCKTSVREIQSRKAIEHNLRTGERGTDLEESGRGIGVRERQQEGGREEGGEVERKETT